MLSGKSVCRWLFIEAPFMLLLVYLPVNSFVPWQGGRLAIPSFWVATGWAIMIAAFLIAQ